MMSVVNVTNARRDIYNLLEKVNNGSEPVTIVNSKGQNAVLVGEQDWKAIEETLYLNNIPGMREHLQVGMKTPIEDCEEYKEDEEW
ncbi:RelB/StbD replicon stabilization protein (antitoxin to RelE/StbE) [Anaerostipes rhamnosivorans]|uniref:Antitoxin n=2 Tax=Anaerostipes rhamnosivorans TaxID=1229621 RepID=A0A4V1EGC4_9FIRM|nr:RelB/StbD replicon stabilization protein (antitoxin to RelE/StbE) [Anaerostipes rhamnosivorans]